MSKNNTNKLVCLISGEFLTERLPEDWYCWGEDELEEFIDEHVIDALAVLDTDDVWDLIYNSAEVCSF
jgi:hypothetical protein